MPHTDLAYAGALIGGVGAAAVLLAPRRSLLLAGFVLLVAAEACLLVSLVPAHDLHRFTMPLGVAAIVVAAAGIVGVAAALVRRPALAPVLLLVAAPFRVPVNVGSERSFLLLPFYGALAAAGLALLYRAVRGVRLPRIPLVLAVPASVYLGLNALSLLWSHDVKQGAIELTFFLFPFAALVAVAARAPWAEWLPRALAGTLVGLGVFFAVVGLWQLQTHHLFFARDVEVTNSYTSYFRVTSLFKDPSIYGRYLVLPIAVLLVLLFLRRATVALVAPLVALLFAGLYVSYSQSSEVTLFAVALAVALLLGDRRAREIVVVASVALALAAGGIAVATAKNSSARRFTSGRSRLVHVTLPVIEHHPLVGVGVGGQPAASKREASGKRVASRNASHTTPLTVAAELGVFGLLAYLAFLAGAAKVLLDAIRVRRALGLALAAVFFAVFVHALFYAGFFEDPVTWGALAVAAAAVAAGVRVRPSVQVDGASDHFKGVPAVATGWRASFARRVARPTPRS